MTFIPKDNYLKLLEKANKEWEAARPPYTLQGFLTVLKENADVAKRIDPNDEDIYEYKNRTQLLDETYGDMIAILENFIRKSDIETKETCTIKDAWQWIEKGFALGYLNQELGAKLIMDTIPNDLIPKWERCIEFLESCNIPPKPKPNASKNHEPGTH